MEDLISNIFAFLASIVFLALFVVAIILEALQYIGTLLYIAVMAAFAIGVLIYGSLRLLELLLNKAEAQSITPSARRIEPRGGICHQNIGPSGIVLSQRVEHRRSAVIPD